MSSTLTTHLVVTRAPLDTLVSVQAGSLDLPAWLRVTLWGWAHADEHGHARAWPGQLRRALTIGTAAEVSRAVAHARERRLLDACSTASCLVLPGHAVAPCEGQHR